VAGQLSAFLDPAREDGYPWGPNCGWMPAAGEAISPAGSRATGRRCEAED